MHVVIIANGVIRDAAQGRALAAQADLLICADGGARYALEWGLQPDIVIGDMDSLEAGDLERLTAAGARLIRHPSRKDETDLELALAQALQEGASEITILGALGGRPDQTLANILLLAWPRLKSVRVTIVEGPDRLFLVRRSVTIQGKKGDIVSLLPLSPRVTHITTVGLEYPLRDEALYRGLTRGISNVMIADEATITVGRGLLWVSHRRCDSEISDSP